MSRDGYLSPHIPSGVAIDSFDAGTRRTSGQFRLAGSSSKVSEKFSLINLNTRCSRA